MADDALRTELGAAIDEAFQTLGPKGFDKAAIVNRFLTRGVSRATLYRWVDQHLATAKPGAKLARKVRESAKAAIRTSKAGVRDKPAAVAEVAERALARAPTVEVSAMLPGGGTVDLLGKLRTCMEAAEQVMAFARKEDGSVKMAKTLLTASDHLRRSIDSVVKLHEAIQNAAAIDTFHREIVGMLEDVAREFPQLAPIVLGRLRSATAAWQV